MLNCYSSDNLFNQCTPSHSLDVHKGPLILAFDIRTCFTLLYIVQLFLTFTDARGENHDDISFNSIDGACSSRLL